MFDFLSAPKAEVLLRRQLEEAQRDRVKHITAAEEHTAWVAMLEIRIARIRSELDPSVPVQAGEHTLPQPFTPQEIA